MDTLQAGDRPWIPSRLGIKPWIPSRLGIRPQIPSRLGIRPQILSRLGIGHEYPPGYDFLTTRLCTWLLTQSDSNSTLPFRAQHRHLGYY